MARLLAATTAKHMATLSATAAGVKDVREALADAERRLGEQGQGTMLFIDEVHRFSKSQQDVLLPAVEDGLVVLIGATTENPFFEVNPPLLSRTSLWRLHPLSPDDLRTLVRRGLAHEGADAEDEAIDAVVAASEGDARAALTTVEVAVGAGPGDARCRSPVVLTIDDMARARDGRLFHQGADEHYDQIERADQERARLGPRRGPLLDGPHARGGRGRPRSWRGAWSSWPARTSGSPTRRRCSWPSRGPGRRVRRAARGGAEPGRGGDLPGAGAEVERRHRRARAGPGRRALGREPGGAGAPAGRALQGGGHPRARRGLRRPARRPLGGGYPAVSS